MGLLGRLFGGDNIEDLGAAYRVDGHADDTLMEEIIADFRASGQDFTLDNLMEYGSQRLVNMGIPPEEVGPTLADLAGQDLRGMTFNQEGIDRLREIWPDAPDQPLKLIGADIRDGVFQPASTVNHVIFDEVTVAKSTDLRGLSFEGFSDESAKVSVGAVDMSGFSVSGDGDHARHMVLEFAGTTARDGNIANSRFTRIEAGPAPDGSPSDLSGLQAENARAFSIHAEPGTDLSDAQFAGATFAPGSRMAGADLRGAHFDGAVLKELDLSHAQLQGASFHGVELGEVDLRGAQLGEAELQGALYNGQVIGQDISAQDVIAAAGIDAGGEQPQRRDARSGGIVSDDRALTTAMAEMSMTQPQIPQDNWAQALAQAASAISPVARQVSYSPTAEEPDVAEISSSAEHQIAQHTIDHSEQYVRAQV